MEGLYFGRVGLDTLLVENMTNEYGVSSTSNRHFPVLTVMPLSRNLERTSSSARSCSSTEPAIRMSLAMLIWFGVPARMFRISFCKMSCAEMCLEQ